ncbi:MAG: transposase [Pseudonocardiaceae bacterium]
MLTHCSIGPDNAAALLIVTGDNPDRLRSKASFATLYGVSLRKHPQDKTSRHRLNRGGDRQANSALYRVALSQLRWNLRTRDYLVRRTTAARTGDLTAAALPTERGGPTLLLADVLDRD